MKFSKLTKPELDNIISNANFTDDEKTVFLFLSKGKTIKEIAQKMSVCSRTVNRIIVRVNEKVHKLEVLN
nr:MAG TPA: hypothetical protein [Caudoviricetes sp.]